MKKHDDERDRPGVLPARAYFRRSLSADISGRLRPTGRPVSAGGAARAVELTETQFTSDYVRTKGDLQERLFEEMGQREQVEVTEADIEREVREFVERILETEEVPLNSAERDRLAEELTEEAVGLGPLEPLMRDPAVTDILVNGPDLVYVERFGKLEPTKIRFRDAEHVTRVIERIAARVGRRIDRASPMVDLRLQDGSRVNATIPPVSIDFPTLSIRRFGQQRLRRTDLLDLRMFSEDMATFLDHAVRSGKNILVSGGTGAGKSTLLGALAESIPDTERIITIEDTAELVLDQRHVVRLESRPPNVEGRGEVRPRDLLINALRMRPTRIIVGEVRGGEALDMLQAMNTGHDGGLTTIHANSPRDALHRLETLVLMAGLELPSRAVREQIVSALHYVVHVSRFEDGVRRVESVAEIVGMEGSTPLLQEIFRFRRQGRQRRRVVGTYEATGIVPRLVDELRERGDVIPTSIFRPNSETPNA